MNGSVPWRGEQTYGLQEPSRKGWRRSQWRRRNLRLTSTLRIGRYSRLKPEASQTCQSTSTLLLLVKKSREACAAQLSGKYLFGLILMNKIKINFVKGLGLESKSLSTNPAVTGTSLGMIEPPALKEAVSKTISKTVS